MSSTSAGNKAFAGKLNGNSRSTTKSTKTLPTFTITRPLAILWPKPKQ
jgi:hypothetical protein